MENLLASLSAQFSALSVPLFAGLCALAYLLGSVPFGLAIAKVFCGIDPRLGGSRNIGTTNVARLCGFHWGVATLLCDAMKSALPTALALYLLGSHFFAGLVGLFALVGHMFSIFLRFKGGKAVATTVGLFLPLAFLPLLISGVICLLIIWRTRYVSLGSLTLATLLPICLPFFGRADLVPLSLLVLLIIVSRHRENIKRLLRGEEKSFMKAAKDPPKNSTK
ncbi:MAG: glycerol-3-phosphate 1-O-acyltransferase PlsY [Deltaproteobacteria bacterium]|jgi:glycerol-3-phosphate acyltransferase PlsY|nr:glycerol-3-phosphate 1-O-acyltransferase PlsY [Deltaproteobacteria bacterium]